MEYKSIRQTLAMSSSTAKPKDAAEEEYQKRLNGYSTYRSGIEFEGHEMFAVAFRELLNVMDSVRGMEVQVESLWAALPPIARRAYLMELIGAEMQSTNSIEAVHTTRKEISDALDAAVADGPHKRLSELAKLFLGLSGENSATLELPKTLHDYGRKTSLTEWYSEPSKSLCVTALTGRFIKAHGRNRKSKCN